MKKITSDSSRHTFLKAGAYLNPDKVFSSPPLKYELGKELRERFCDIPWVAIQSHNKIDELRAKSNREFPKLKRHLIVGVRKSLTHTPNHKVSDFLVPYTSSGCSAICLYCYLVCNYNKCSYLRLFVNREQMLYKIIKTADDAQKDLVFEIGATATSFSKTPSPAILNGQSRTSEKTRRG